ncbi:MAG: RNA 3'-terminal phosphate cyclase [Isosphaeraceae bacterium]
MEWPRQASSSGKRWITHAGHDSTSDELGALVAPRGPHLALLREFLRGSNGKHARRQSSGRVAQMSEPKPNPTPRPKLVTLDGSRGEGGGQILRTALTLSLLTGRPFRLVKVRANREKPGLRPQHLTAVKAAAELGNAEVTGGVVGSRDLTFRPGDCDARDLGIDVGTAGSTALVLQTLHLPLALRANSAVRVTLTGGTFNLKAPSFPFLHHTWRAHLATLGAPVALTMPSAGFYPRGGGMLDAWIEPATLRPISLIDRGTLVRIRGEAGVARLSSEIAERLRDRAAARLAEAGIDVAVQIDPVEWDAPSPGAAIHLSAEFSAEGLAPATFVGLGERGKPAETVADEAVDELLAHLSAPSAAVDPHSADQILIPLALAEGPSAYSVSEITEHLRTNVQTIQAFIDRPIRVEDPTETHPGRVLLS